MLPLVVPYSHSRDVHVSLAILLQLQGDRPRLALRSVRDVLRAHVLACRACSVVVRPCGAGVYCAQAAENTRTPSPHSSEGGTAYVFSSSLNVSGVSSLSATGDANSTGRPSDGHASVPLISADATGIELCHGCFRYVHGACWVSELQSCLQCSNTDTDKAASLSSDSAASSGADAVCLHDLADREYF